MIDEDGDLVFTYEVNASLGPLRDDGWRWGFIVVDGDGVAPCMVAAEALCAIYTSGVRHYWRVRPTVEREGSGVRVRARFMFSNEAGGDETEATAELAFREISTMGQA